MSKQQIDTFCPKSRADWRQWLEKNHQSEQSVWLVYYKSSASVTSLSWSDAVEEALCFGWIDSTRRTIDQERFMQYFSRRKPGSTWSKINKEKVEKLIQQKLMTQAGYDSIKTAKSNGSWSLLDEVEAMVVPEDLKAELTKYDNAMEYFDKLSNSDTKILLHWVTFAKRSETRQKRIFEIVESAREGLKPKQFR